MFERSGVVHTEEKDDTFKNEMKNSDFTLLGFHGENLESTQLFSHRVLKSFRDEI